MNFKMKKLSLCCGFTQIVFIKLSFAVAFLVIRKTWDGRFASKVKKWGIVRNGGNDFEIGGSMLFFFMWNVRIKTNNVNSTQSRSLW